MAEGAFRHGLAYWRGKFNTSGTNIRTKYSEAVHFVDREQGPYIKDSEGKLYNPKLIKPVPPESKRVRVPRWLHETGQANRDEKREELWPWARRIHRWMQNYLEQHEANSVSALQVTRAFEDRPGFQAALEAAQLGTLRMRDVARKPVAIMQLLPRWFRRMSEKGQLWKPIGGDMPEAYAVEPADEYDEE